MGVIHSHEPYIDLIDLEQSSEEEIWCDKSSAQKVERQTHWVGLRANFVEMYRTCQKSPPQTAK